MSVVACLHQVAVPDLPNMGWSPVVDVLLCNPNLFISALYNIMYLYIKLFSTFRIDG